MSRFLTQSLSLNRSGVFSSPSTPAPFRDDFLPVFFDPEDSGADSTLGASAFVSGAGSDPPHPINRRVEPEKTESNNSLFMTVITDLP